MHTELQTAQQIAWIAHAGQTDKQGEPYIYHVMRVVELAARNGGDEKVQATAWLHDVIEDSKWTFLDLMFFEISEEVRTAVGLLTRDADRSNQTYSQYIEHIKESGNQLAIQVKLADLRDHLNLGDFPQLQIRYRKAWFMLTGQEATDESVETA